MWWSHHRLVFFGKRDMWGKCDRTPGIPGLRAVPDLITILPTLPPTVHLHPCILLASCSRLVEVKPSF